MKQHLQFVAGLLLAIGLSLPTGYAQGTSFTYQGRLNHSGTPANGTNYGMVFYLYDAPTGGNLLGNEGIASVTISNGLFTVPLNFDKVFDGDPRWLEISVQTNGGAFSTLSPRQPITPTPYAMFANTASNVSGTVSGAQISGAIPLSGLPVGVLTNGASGVNITGTFTGNGAGVTNVNFVNLNSGGVISIATNRGNFVVASSLPVGSGPVSVATADVNSDGRIDVICANQFDGTLRVLINNGSGQFSAGGNPSSGGLTTSVTTADVNGDSKPDLISVNAQNSTLTILTNNGTGLFPVPSQITVGGTPASVIAADVNFDGKQDLITANFDAHTLVVLTNTGSGGFAFASTNGVGPNPFSVTKADVNLDGKVDLISANYGSGTLTVLTNNGSGRFFANATNTVNGSPRCVIAADMNNDGKIDLISAGGLLTVLTNNGSGGFLLAASPIAGGQAYSVTAADVNGDGKMDLATANYDNLSSTVLLNDGNGGFTIGAALVAGYQPYSIASADINNDGKMDLICANYGGNTLTVSTNSGSATIFFNGNISGDGGGLTGLNANAIVGGLTTNLSVTTPSGTRNLIFVNGTLRAVQ